MSRMMKQHRRAAQTRKAYGTADYISDRDPEIEQPSMDDVRVARTKRAGLLKGKFVNLFQTPKNTLEIIPNHNAVAEFINDHAEHLGDDILALVDPNGEKTQSNLPRHNIWGDHQVLKELLQDHLSAGWHWLEPSDIGALTKGPILEGPDGRIYYHEGYQLQSGSDELLQGKTIKFDGAPENRTPVEAQPAVEDLPKAASTKKADEQAPFDPNAPAVKLYGPVVLYLPVGFNTVPTVGDQVELLYSIADDPKTTPVESQRMLRVIKKITKGASATKKADVYESAAGAGEPAAEPCDDYEGHMKPWGKCWNCRHDYSQHPEYENSETQKKYASKKAAEDEPLLPEEGDDLAPEQDALPTPPPPAPTEAPEAPMSNGNPYQGWKSENLIETIESLTDSETFAQDKPEQDAVAQMAETLSTRPIEAEPMVEQAKKSALNKVKQAGLFTFTPQNQDTAKILEGDKSIPEGRSYQEDNTGIDHPKTELPSKFATQNDPSTNDETSSVLEGDKSIPEGKDEVEDHTGVDAPATTLPEKVAAAPITTAKALSLVEDLIEELKTLYMDAKPITTANESRPVREAVESIYHATKALGNAQKILLKQKQQEEQEIETEKINAAKNKKSSFLSIANLKLAEMEEEDGGEEGSDEGEMKEANAQAPRTASVKERQQFKVRVSSAKGLKVTATEASPIADAVLRTAAAYGVAHRACSDEATSEENKGQFEAKKSFLQGKLQTLAAQLGMTATFDEGNQKSVKLTLASGATITVPTP